MRVRVCACACVDLEDDQALVEGDVVPVDVLVEDYLRVQCALNAHWMHIECTLNAH